MAHVRWGEREAAFMAASSVSPDEQMGLVHHVLANNGPGETDLRCNGGVHSAARLLYQFQTGFLVASVFHSWHVAIYHQADRRYPAQHAAMVSRAEATEIPAVDIRCGADGSAAAKR